MQTLTCSSPAEASALVAHVRRAMDRGLAVWGITYTPDGPSVTVRGVRPVVSDVLRSFRSRGL